jgi:hypothetical protein
MFKKEDISISINGSHIKLWTDELVIMDKPDAKAVDIYVALFEALGHVVKKQWDCDKYIDYNGLSRHEVKHKQIHYVTPNSIDKTLQKIQAIVNDVFTCVSKLPKYEGKLFNNTNP